MKFSVIANPEKYSVKKPLEDLIKWSKTSKTKIYFNHTLSRLVDGESHRHLNITESEEDAIDACDIIITLGGDGTMLYTARLSKNIQKPILGINSGKLGFMANTQHKDLYKALDDIKIGNYRIDKRYMLEAQTNGGKTYHALNEFLFAKKDTASMILVEAMYDDHLINKYWADGLIVASPTGSTAYNLSAFGPIVMPGSNVLVLTPINPHTLTTRPMILPSDKPLKMTVREQRNDILFSFDGQLLEIDSYPFHVNLKRSNFTVDLIELPGHSYFETLRSKLMWGRDFRDQI